ncbi:hypothetical protein ACFTWS_05680 [Streptomyces sp. NPDC057027]|uniref:hypothetical protein n=1 Tax=Streptomyces sp. NPDC057027 TaxID=3346004 RepID=UPI00363416C2
MVDPVRSVTASDSRRRRRSGRRPGDPPSPHATSAAAPALSRTGGYCDGGWGGNKVRKLEWLLPEARRRGARTILTVGGLGTNWGLAAASYAREIGLGVALGLIDHPVDAHVRAQLERLRASCTPSRG